MSTMTGPDACVAMHAALRKCCSSPATTAMYNLVHLVIALSIKPRNLDPWRLLGELVADEMDAGHAPEQALLCCAGVRTNILEHRWEAIVEERRKANNPRPEGSSEARAALNTIVNTMRCFSPTDFEGMSAYLKEG